jgi:hypothetical protein
MAAVTGFCECAAVSPKMYTFVSGKNFWGQWVMAIRVYFCIPAKNDYSRKIKDLAQKMYTFVYFCIPFIFGRDRFCFKSTG